jgi:hypothetical protein
MVKTHTFVVNAGDLYSVSMENVAPSALPVVDLSSVFMESRKYHVFLAVDPRFAPIKNKGHSV